MKIKNKDGMCCRCSKCKKPMSIIAKKSTSEVTVYKNKCKCGGTVEVVFSE